VRAKINLVVPERDVCQTPEYALIPIEKLCISNKQIIWECCCGKGNIVKRFLELGYKVIGTDILEGHDFFEYSPENWDCIITNPPFRIKYQWLARCYDLGKPFALLLPLETLGAARAQKLFSLYGMELIVLNQRVNFEMPRAGYTGGGSQFPVAWFTHGFDIGKQITYATINNKGTK
jgi:hypothetical protein